jgi:hypothetical protein
VRCTIKHRRENCDSQNPRTGFHLCLTATAGFTPSRFNGKWATDRPADPLTAIGAQRTKRGTGIDHEDGKASGSLGISGLGGRFYTFKDGKVTDNKIQMRVDPQSTEYPWTLEDHGV